MRARFILRRSSKSEEEKCVGGKGERRGRRMVKRDCVCVYACHRRTLPRRRKAFPVRDYVCVASTSCCVPRGSLPRSAKTPLFEGVHNGCCLLSSLQRHKSLLEGGGRGRRRRQTYYSHITWRIVSLFFYPRPYRSPSHNNHHSLIYSDGGGAKNR